MTSTGLKGFVEKQQDPLRPYRRVHDHIDRHFYEYVEEIRKFLRVPGISTTGEGMYRSAEVCRDYLRMLGSDVQIVETPLHPIVFGRLNSSQPNAKTLIVYSLYDETPVWAEEWVTPPFAAEIVEPARLNLPEHLGSLICGRAAVNQRGPQLAFILALQAMQEVTGDVPANIIWLWEGEEEIGSPSLPRFIERHKETFRNAHAFYMPSMRQNWFGSMVLNRGYKGTVLLELECKGGAWGGTLNSQHLWGGHVLWVDAPLMRLIKAVASLFDEGQDIAIDGLADRILPTSPEDQADLEEIERQFTAELEEMFKRQMGIARFKRGKSGKELFIHYLCAPAINVEGIIGGYTGPTYFTHLPQSAVAKLEFRLVPGLSPETLVGLLRRHLDRRGFSEIEIKTFAGYDACRTSREESILSAAVRAADLHGVKSFVWPTVQAFCPGALLSKAPFNLPVCFAGLGHGEKYHQSNEYITVEGIRANMKYAVTFLHEWAKL